MRERDCAETLIGPEYGILPTVACAASSNPMRRNCDVEEYCAGDGDCTEKAHGLCTGVPSAICDYGIARQPCTTSEDCSSLPNGVCPPGILQGELCYPSGECEAPAPVCYYRETPCDSDSDCTDAPGGRCLKRILYASCEYHDCKVDTDCGEGSRCACHSCVPSSCTDGSCASGETCHPWDRCHGFPGGYACTTPDDECTSKDDCGGAPCEASDGRFRCRTAACPTIP